jgi:hypothetical protein
MRGTLIMPKFCEDISSWSSLKIIVDGVELFVRAQMDAGEKAVEFDIPLGNRRKAVIEFVAKSTDGKTNYPWLCDVYLVK